jgi:hypothetical protein
VAPDNALPDGARLVIAPDEVLKLGGGVTSTQVVNNKINFQPPDLTTLADPHPGPGAFPGPWPQPKPPAQVH